MNVCGLRRKKGGRASTTRNMDLFRDNVSDMRLRDLGYEGSPFTWSKRGKNCPGILKRLDCFQGNDVVVNLFTNLKVSHLNWYSFDHRPICFHTNNLV